MEFLNRLWGWIREMYQRKIRKNIKKVIAILITAVLFVIGLVCYSSGVLSVKNVLLIILLIEAIFLLIAAVRTLNTVINRKLTRKKVEDVLSKKLQLRGDEILAQSQEEQLLEKAAQQLDEVVRQQENAVQQLNEAIQKIRDAIEKTRRVIQQQENATQQLNEAVQKLDEVTQQLEAAQQSDNTAQQLKIRDAIEKTRKAIQLTKEETFTSRTFQHYKVSKAFLLRVYSVDKEYLKFADQYQMRWNTMWTRLATYVGAVVAGTTAGIGFIQNVCPDVDISSSGKEIGTNLLESFGLTLGDVKMLIGLVVITIFIIALYTIRWRLGDDSFYDKIIKEILEENGESSAAE